MAAWPTTAWTGWPTMRRPGPRTRRCPPSAVPLPTADDVVTGNRFRSLVILTGAGISAESGLGTFRDTDGLWTQYDLNDVATPEGFLRNPALVHGFYNARRRNLVAEIGSANV